MSNGGGFPGMVAPQKGTLRDILHSLHFVMCEVPSTWQNFQRGSMHPFTQWLPSESCDSRLTGAMDGEDVGDWRENDCRIGSGVRVIS